MNLHYSQTIRRYEKEILKFKYLMNLHYSQTTVSDFSTELSLNTL